MATRNDSIITDYAVNVPLTNGVTWNGPLLTLNAAMSVSFQMITTNGAAGTWVFNPTNVADVAGPVWYSNGLPLTQNTTNGTIAANTAGSAVILQGQQSLAFAKGWLSFAPTASGNLYVAALVRRYPVS